MLVLDVDGDVLRGSGSPLQADVSQALGVAPGTVRRCEGKDLEVTVSWPMTSWMGGTIGSLRGAVIAPRRLTGTPGSTWGDVTTSLTGASASVV